MLCVWYIMLFYIACFYSLLSLGSLCNWSLCVLLMIKNNNTTFHSHPVRLSKVEKFMYSCIMSVILQMRHFSSLLILNIWLFLLQPFAALYLSFVLHSSVILLKMYFHKCLFCRFSTSSVSYALCIITEGWNLPLSSYFLLFFKRIIAHTYVFIIFTLILNCAL